MNTKLRTALGLCGIAATSFDQGVTPSKITIVPCNNALGFVKYEPTSDLLIATPANMEEQLELAVAGHVAQRLFTDGVDMGFINEFARARDIIRMMREFGDTRDEETIMKAAAERVTTNLLANERNVRRLADALVREETLDARAFQQIIGGE